VASSVSPARSSTAPLIAVFLTVVIDLLGFGIVIPLLPIYSKVYGADEATLGWLMGCHSGMQLLFAPVFGRLSDRFGRRPILIGGLIGTAASYVVFATADSLALLFVSRLAAGMFGANLSAAQAFVADVTTPKDRAKGMGMIGAAFGIGFTLGPPFGGLLTKLGPAAPGLVAAGLSLAAAAYGYAKLPSIPPKPGVAATSSFAALRSAFSDARARALFSIQFLTVFAFAGFESMFTRFGLDRFPERFGLSTTADRASREEIEGASVYVGAYFAYIGVMAAVVQGGLIRRLIPRFGEFALMIAGPLVLGLSFFGIGIAPAFGGWTVVLVSCAIMPFGFGLTNPSLAGLISRAAPRGRQGDRLGVSQSVSAAARLAGPPALGLTFATGGASSPFFFGVLLLVVAASVALAFRARHAASFSEE
jgi:MFS transporter, DHA1 family, tetracycline resistance protein